MEPEKEGFDAARYRRHREVGTRLQGELRDRGFRSFTDEDHRLRQRTAVHLPADRDEAPLRRALLDRHGIVAAALALAFLAGCRSGAVGVAGPPSPAAAAALPTFLPAGSTSEEIRRTVLLRLAVSPVEPEAIDHILHTGLIRDPAITERVEFWVTFWTTRGAGTFSRYLERMAAYEALVVQELAERGLPASLKFLPVVESGYSYSAVSRVGATGMWQIMRPTARDLGLSVSAVVDDRRDPIGSTRAALDYLEELHRTFGSWSLALSAYNAGPGRVMRAMNRHVPDRDGLSGDEIFLRVRPHLPPETRDFVPRFFAAAVLASEPGRFGFRRTGESAPFDFDEVTVPDATSLDVVARAAEVELDEITALNPHLLRGFTPRGEERVIRVPAGTGPQFEANYALIPPEERITFLEHSVRRGETLSHIARRYGVSVAELGAANGRVDPRRLQIGQILIVPVAGAPRPAQVASARTHRVRRGDTWGGLARRYGVSAEELARTNGRSTRHVIRIGEELTIP